MKNVMNKYQRMALVACMVLLAINIVSCGNDHKGHDHGDMNQQETKIDSSIVRTGIIDLQSLDLNNDGMVYQDPMDWNVISDKPGRCPLCRMELKEVTIKEAKENLVKNGFSITDN